MPLADADRIVDHPSVDTVEMPVRVSVSSVSDDVEMETLTGHYIEAGMNHGRKYFKRVEEDPDDANPVLYFFMMTVMVLPRLAGGLVSKSAAMMFGL